MLALMIASGCWMVEDELTLVGMDLGLEALDVFVPGVRDGNMRGCTSYEGSKR
jgi:hypothetical protein